MCMAGCRNMSQLGNSFGGFKILLKWGDKKPAGHKGLLNMDTCAMHFFLRGGIFCCGPLQSGAIEVDNATDAKRMFSFSLPASLCTLFEGPPWHLCKIYF